MKTTLINLLQLGWEKITYAICCGWIFSFFIPIIILIIEVLLETGKLSAISVIIFVGIASSLPSSFIQIFDLSRTGGYSFLSILMVFAMFVGILLLICFIENSYKKINHNKKILFNNFINYYLINRVVLSFPRMPACPAGRRESSLPAEEVRS